MIAKYYEELETYFKDWDKFIRLWKRSKSMMDYNNSPNNFNFLYPNKIMNCTCCAIESFHYLPEPYWGWTPYTGKELKVVVVNYNPGSGGPMQFANSSNVKSIKNYSEYVNEQLTAFLNFKKTKKGKPSQYETTNWHANNRARQLSILTSADLNGNDSFIDNYLGIDLVPWHTKNVQGLNGYLESNINAIKKRSLDFAILAVTKIKEKKFKNIVIVRTSQMKFKTLFKKEFESRYFKEISPIIVGENNDSFCRIKIDKSNVEMYLLWGRRNDLPSAPFLKDVFKIK